MSRYTVTDGNADLAIDAETAQDAAQQYVDGGDWHDAGRTTWITCYVTPLDADGEPLEGEREQITITVDPTAPRCTAEAHDWQSPHAVVGGLAENPGVHGHGGGVIGSEVCAHCGTYRVTDTWAQDSATGRQGLESIAYREADDASLGWVEAQQDEPASDDGVSEAAYAILLPEWIDLDSVGESTEQGEKSLRDALAQAWQERNTVAQLVAAVRRAVGR